MSAEEIAQAFVGHFYNSFDTNVDSLASLFVSIDRWSLTVLPLMHAQC
jgi:hypothetical protein